MVIPLHAGQEKSVAATKSYIAQLIAGVRLVSLWSQNTQLQNALNLLPNTLSQACQMNWSHAISSLTQANRLFVIGGDQLCHRHGIGAQV